MLNYRNRDILLQKAREKALIPYENHRISLYPDYTVLVQRQRSSYQAVKRKLQKARLKYALLYPARLKVIYDKKTHFFESTADAEEWLEVMCLGSSQSGRSDNSSQGSGGLRRLGSWRVQKSSKNKGGAGPSREQQRLNQDGALAVARTFREDSTKIPTDSEDSTINSDSEHRSNLFPTITPRAADDILDN